MPEHALSPAPAAQGSTLVAARSRPAPAALRWGSEGRVLAPAARVFFERRMGHDFGAVRVHSGPSASRVTDALAARAFTAGEQIVLGRDEPDADQPSAR